MLRHRPQTVLSWHSPSRARLALWDRGDLGIRVGPGVFRIGDQPIDRPTLDLVGRPRPLISGLDSRAGARTRPSRGDHHRDLNDAELPGSEHLAWPAIRPPSSPTSAGDVQPHSLMLAAIAAIWASVWAAPFLDARGDRGDL